MQALRLATLSGIARLFGKPRAIRIARGWRELARDPDLVRDLCTLGHLFESDIDPATGRIYDADELRERAARKSMALALLARAEITHSELNAIRQESFEDEFDDDA
ncbi:hypothetical protein [Oceaniglobus trochenteri]|uniref:hypothetical protein n=1 Tax=Oceaniglobus trochenteri TaxID=2763260 RepID=UPI001CFF5A38|nr:hypothetical protein [Oceaniglobus trochenteri]